jgi:hypothetical protein
MAKKPVKKVPAKKTPAKAKTKPQTKAKPKAKPKAKSSTAKKLGVLQSKTPKLNPKDLAKRPAVNPPIPVLALNSIAADLNSVKADLEEYAAHLRSLDRKRLNGVGIKKLGFIERAFELAAENPEFLPHYLTLEKFRSDHQLFILLRSLYDTNKQITELLWNLVITTADMDYTDALEFYASVRKAAKRRVDAAESIFREMETFFKRKKGEGGEPTEKEILRDAKAYLHNKRDGKVIIENVKPKLAGGKHKVIDEKFQDSERFKDTVEGEINE